MGATNDYVPHVVVAGATTSLLLSPSLIQRFEHRSGLLPTVILSHRLQSTRVEWIETPAEPCLFSFEAGKKVATGMPPAFSILATVVACVSLVALLDHRNPRTPRSPR